MRLPRNAQIWLPGLLKTHLERIGAAPIERVWLAICDHYEPLWGNADAATGRARVARWREQWPAIAARHRDSLGRPAQYTFFFPEEEYRPEFLDPLAEMRGLGVGDVEVHLHHDRDIEGAFVERMGVFLKRLESHGLLRRRNGKPAFGFIHGNWALDNSLPSGRWCGLNNEITLLARLGCYADFTLPSAPSPAQTRIVNTIYWATDDPDAPKSHDRGQPLRPGDPPRGDLLMIPGPLGVRRSRRRRYAPALETGELAAHDPVTAGRAGVWLRMSPRVGGDVFVKLFAHGTQEDNSRALLEGGELDRTLALVSQECARRQARVRFVSAYGMWLAVEALRENRDPEAALDEAAADDSR